MKKVNLNLLILILILFTAGSNVAQVIVSPTSIKQPVGFAISGPLRNNPVVSFEEFSAQEIPIRREINSNVLPPDFSNMQPDIGKQSQGGSNMHILGITNNYAGQNTNLYPPDASGDVNENYYFQTVNLTYAIYNKSDGSIAAGPSPLNSIFNPSLPGAGFNNGDPIVLWDENANRWFFAEFSIGTPPYYQENDYILIAVSQTDDPTGSWYSWSFDVSDVPDYPKFGIWQDGYYMATNNPYGNDVYVFDRAAMIEGSSNPTMIGFDNPNRPNTFDGFHCILPLDNDGPWAPSGTPGQFITIVDDEQGNPSDAIWIYELNVDWTTPSNSTFARTQILNVNPFSGNFNNSWNNIPQPGTSQKLDGISTVLMHRAQYRNFNGIQKIVCNHTIAVSENEAAIRWYELDNTGSGWFIAQQGTYNPDNVSRWCASIAMNDIGEIAMGYSVSDGSSTYPGIRFCGQSNSAPPNIMDVAETTIWTGSYSQTEFNRWGDYANISVDPSDGRTFWFTTEYKESSTSTKGTRIASFSFSNTAEVLVDQKRESGQLMTGTHVSRWENNNFVDYTVPIPPFSFNTGDTEVLKGLQGLVTDPYEKYNIWVRNNTNNEPDVKNHHQFTILPNDNSLTSQFKKTYSSVTIKNSLEGTTSTGGNLEFRDPWFIDYQDPNFAYQWRNRGMDSALFYSRTSPFYPDYNTSYNGLTYKGVFLNQGYNPINNTWTPPYYSVKADAVQDIPLSQTGKMHRFYFQNWGGTNANFQNANALETPVVFTLDGATAQANLKGTQLSGVSTGFSNSSQRKLVVTSYPESYYHLVYASGGSVWYEKAQVNYDVVSPVNWQLMNGAKPLNGELNITEAKSPSIDYVYATHNTSEENYYIYIVYQKKKTDGKYEIRLSKFDKNSSKIFDTQVFNSAYANYSTVDCMPVVGVSRQSNDQAPIKIVVLWKRPDEGTSSAGLYYLAGFDQGTSINWTDNYPNPDKIATTDANSTNPSIAAFKSPLGNIYYHLAYQQGTSQIKYVAIAFGVRGTGSSTPTVVSSGSGSNTNISPSITVSSVYGGDNTYDSPKIVWCNLGDDGNGFYRYRSTMQNNWSPFYIYYENDDVQSPTISGPKYHPSGIDDVFHFGWSWLEGYYKSYVVTNNLSQKLSMPYHGKNIQIANNREDWDGFGYCVLDNVSRTSAPFTFENKWITPQLNKSAIANIHSGRAGTVIKNDAEFYFAFGDIKLNDKPIEFEALNDTVTISTSNDLNSYLLTNAFDVNDNSILTYSVYYGLTDSLLSFNSLSPSDQINFRIEIIDAKTKQVLGTFDNLTQTKQHLVEYDNKSYRADLSGIGNRTIKLGLNVANNFAADYSLSNIYSFNQKLAKSNISNLSWNDAKTVKEFSLGQNYPNPFNPSTKIKYQLPKDGFVTLKVYDILGNEVATLVNEEKIAGKYEANFNASSLASGVYIYKIQAGDFVNSKKMILLK